MSPSTEILTETLRVMADELADAVDQMAVKSVGDRALIQNADDAVEEELDDLSLCRHIYGMSLRLRQIYGLGARHPVIRMGEIVIADYQSHNRRNSRQMSPTW